MEKCTNIDFTLARAANVDLSIFDLQGRKIRTLLNGLRSPGTHGWFWDGKKTDGSYADNGVYFLRLRAGGERRVLTQKIALARR
jgi:flagellar hook assembly protein FlgD